MPVSLEKVILSERQKEVLKNLAAALRRKSELRAYPLERLIVFADTCDDIINDRRPRILEWRRSIADFTTRIPDIGTELAVERLLDVPWIRKR